MDEADASVETTVTADRTVVEYRGADAAAVVVRSPAGERVYLPLVDEDDGDDGEPERTSPYGGEPPGTGPYGGADDTSDGETETPYGGTPGTSPYGADAGPEPGIRATADGFRVVHPEPATDVRVLR